MQNISINQDQVHKHVTHDKVKYCTLHQTLSNYIY